MLNENLNIAIAFSAGVISLFLPAFCLLFPPICRSLAGSPILSSPLEELQDGACSQKHSFLYSTSPFF